MPESRKLGTVVTFYSWKGGVGRTMALANTAVQLARSGHDVLMIDWDLEAPGLDRYFFRGQDLEAKYIEVSPAREPGGLLALLSTARQRSDGRLGAEEWPRVTATIRLQPAEATSTMPYAPLPGRLDLIASGDGADGYADQLGTFSWTSFYAESRGGQWVEEARRQWISSYDFVLIDSRTGLSDIGGICTIQLPDTLVLVFVANDQSFDGGTRVVKAAQRARRNFGYDRGQLTVVPLLSRWCGDEETDIAKVWLRRFDKDLSVQVASWLPKMFSPREFLEKVRVPHVARFTFGEPLPVLTHSLTDPMFPGLAFDLLCRLLASNMAEVGKIIDPNYEPKISIAPDTEDHEPLWRGEGLRVYISAVSSEFGQARDALESDLQNIGISSRWIGYFPASSGRTALQLLHDYIRECNVVICLVGAKSGACPSDAESEPFAQFLPPRITVASYTQWEFFFAQYYRRDILVYCASNQYESNNNRAAGSSSKDSHLQVAFFGYIKASGFLYTYFSDINELRAAVLTRDWPQAKPPKPIDLHYPSIGPLFKGRKTFLDRLHASLTRPDGGTAAIAGRAVHGMGGVGKTRAAVEYAWGHRDDYTALFLIDAETPDKLHTAFAALAAPLRLPAAAAPEEAVRLEAVRDWLNANPTWLLILDNVDTEPALAAANRLVGRLAGGHVLMTSRLTQFPRGVERLDLDVLSLDDATSFLLEATATGRRRTPDDAAEARALAEALGQLALALEMAAATIDARGWSFTKYQEIWQGNRARVVGWARPEIIGYRHAVAETWQASVDQLTPAAGDLLQRLAFLAPEPVPESLLDVPVPGATAADDPHAALDDLATYSLATRDAGEETFLVHRLVQDVTRRGISTAGMELPRLTEALAWVNAAFAGDPQDVRNWRVLEPLASHAEAVAGYADAAGIAEPTEHLMGQLAVLFWAKALDPRAEAYFRRALAIAQANLRPGDPRISLHLNNLAQVLQDTNRFGEAEPLMRRALAIDETSHIHNPPKVAIRLNNLAQLLQATNRLGEAEPLMRRALAIDEASYGQDHPDVARDLNNLAQLLQDTNRLGEAEPLMRRALAIDEASYGQDHPNVARDLNNLAVLLQATDRLGEAEPLMRHRQGRLALDLVGKDRDRRW